MGSALAPAGARAHAETGVGSLAEERRKQDELESKRAALMREMSELNAKAAAAEFGRVGDINGKPCRAPVAPKINDVITARRVCTQRWGGKCK